MANNKLPFGLCKEYGINLPKGATPGDAWEALKKHGVVDKSGNIVHKANTSYDDILRIDTLTTGKGGKIKRSSLDFPTVILPRKEYAHVMSEIATNMSKEDQKKSVLTKFIGDYAYTFENNGFGNYRIIKKVPIDED